MGSRNFLRGLANRSGEIDGAQCRRTEGLATREISRNIEAGEVNEMDAKLTISRRYGHRR